MKKHVCLEEKEARGIVKQISFALKYMFEQRHRVIHYDLKPSNIIFHNGVVKIIDFGLCKRMDS
jgi:tousled-like kinase